MAAAGSTPVLAPAGTVPLVPAAGAAERLPARVQGLSCPSCGGALEVDPGLRVVVCPFCAKPLLAAGEAGIRRFAVEPRLDAGEAREAARKWLASGWNKDRRLPKEAVLGEAFLCFLPFFRVQADVVGHALGTEERRRTTGSGKNRRTVTYEVDVERSAAKAFDRTWAAVQVAEWGVRRVNLAGDHLVPFDNDVLERRGMVFPPTLSETEVRRQALAAFKEEADPAKGLKRVRFQFLETLRERMSIVYYPLWVVRYRFRDRSYQVLVDAEDGTLAYGKAPGNDLYRAAMLVLSEAVACFVVTTLLQWGVFLDDDDGCGGLLALFAFLVFVIGWGWRRFRWGGVVIEGSGLVQEEKKMKLEGGLRKMLSAAFQPPEHR